MSLAHKFEQMVLADDRFEIPSECHLGMVVFRLKGENDMTEKLLKKLNGSGRILDTWPPAESRNAHLHSEGYRRITK